MIYPLSDGGEINLRSNTEAAKFILLVMPFKGLTFSGNVKPHIKSTPDVLKFAKVAAEMHKVRKKKADKIGSGSFYDSEVPFRI